MFNLVFTFNFVSISDSGNFFPRIGVKNAEASTDPGDNQYAISIGPVDGSATSGYVYTTVFNPAGSGKTISIARIRMSVDARGTATWATTTIRRISAVSAGTTISASDIPKKNSESANSIAEIRYANGAGSVTYVGGANSRVNQLADPGAAGSFVGRDELVFTSSERLILKPGEGIALMQEGAGSLAHVVRLTLTWDELNVTPSAQNEYILAYPRVENVGASEYKYQTFMNPSGSGKTFLVKRLSLDVDADAAVSNQNELHIRRITAASGGTAISTSDIPKKNTDSSTSAADARYLGVTATLANGGSAIIAVHGLTAASQPQGHWEWYAEDGDEYIVLQAGEGLAVVGSATGDVDQLVRLSVVWQEISSGSTPTAQNEYMAVATSSGVVASGTNYTSFYNPVGSGKTAIVKRLGIMVDATTTAVYATATVQRITSPAPTGGTAIAVANITKKNTSSSNSVMDLRGGSLTVTKSGGPDARILSVRTPGAVGQLSGHKEIYFKDEPLILKEGEGVVLYTEGVGHGALKYKMYMEWQETASAPSSQGEYVMTIGPVIGTTATPEEYYTVFNPVGSGKTMVVKRVGMRADAIAAGTYIPLYLKRLTTPAPSGGTLISASDIPKKNTSTSNSIAEIRWATTSTSVIYENGSSTRAFLAGTSPGAVPSATSLQQSGYDDASFTSYEKLILQPGQGIVFTQEGAGDVEDRPLLDLEWEETASTPTTQNEYMMVATSSGSTTSGNVFATFFNQSGSNYDIVIKRLGISTDAAAAAIYATTSVRKITASSGGYLISSATYPRKNTNTTSSSMEMRINNPSVTYLDGTDSRIIGRTTPAVVGQAIGSIEFVFITGAEMVLHPGEGIALFQEAGGDVDHRNFLKVVWSEVPVTLPAVQTFFASNVHDTSATLNGKKNGGGAASQYGFAYSTNSTFATGVSTTTLGSISGTSEFSDTATSLSANTTYYFRAYATNVTGTIYGVTRSFYTGNSSITRKILLFGGYAVKLIGQKLKLFQK